jgi:hypothetical protein
VAILPPLEREDGFTVDVRVEGQSKTIWSGAVTVTEGSIVDDYAFPLLRTADRAGRAGAGVAGRRLLLRGEKHGLRVYVESIRRRGTAGLAGWGFRVDYYSPMVGAADFVGGRRRLPFHRTAKCCSHTPSGDKPH